MNRANDRTLLDEMLRHQTLPLPLIKQAAKEILELIREGLNRDGVVHVSNFGSFRLKPVAARRGINPQTREAITIPAHQRVSFTPCKALRELIEPNPQPPVVIPASSDGVQSTQPHVAMAPLHPVVAALIKNDGITGNVTLLPNAKDALAESGASRAPEITPAMQETEAEKDIAHVSGQLADVFEEQPARDILNHDNEGRGTLELDLGRIEANDSSEQKHSRVMVAAAVVIFALTAAMLLVDIDKEREASTAATASKTPVAPVASVTANADVMTEASLGVEKHDANSDVGQGANSGAQQERQGSLVYFSEQNYEIAHGDSLWRLAGEHYHDPYLWPHIFQANRESITDPDQLQEGAKLLIPALQGSPDDLSNNDRRNIAEGYYLAYLHYKQRGREEAILSLLVAKRYDRQVVERHQRQLQVSLAEMIVSGKER